MKSLLISVHHDLAQKIITGEKPWEMRKGRPSTFPDYVLIYAKKPVGKVIGYCKLSKFRKYSQVPYQCTLDRISVEGMRPGHINFSIEFLRKVCITADEFHKYFNGKQPQGYIFELAEATAIAPVALPFHPPQQWMYFDGHPETIIDTWRI